MSLQAVLKMRRKELSLTLKEIADRMGVTEATVQRWESGNIKNLRHERITKLAEILDTTPAYLMGWDELPDKAEQSEEEAENEELFNIFSSLPEDRQKIVADLIRTLSKGL